MYAQSDTTTSSSRSSAATPTPSRAVLRTRPDIQRALIRSWEYAKPIRVTVLAIRLLVALWLVVLTALLMSAGQAWAWILLLAAAAVAAIGLWAFTTAAKGWPTVES